MFITLGGAALGALARYLVPGRREHGALLVPTVGAVAACAVWAVLTWAGLAFDGGWIWLISLVLASAAALTVAVVLPRRRRSVDSAMLARLIRA